MKYHFILFSVIVLFASCGEKAEDSVEETSEEYLDIITTEEIEKPVESYSFIDAPIVEPSIVNIPINLNLPELEKMVNREFDVVLAQNSAFEQDGYKVEIEKLEDVKLGLEGQRIKYLVPLKLNVAKNIGFGNMKADGAIAIQFYTDFDIQQDWKLETTSAIERYEWLEKPKLRMGGISLPAGFVGDIIIDRSKEIITKTIDDQIKDNFDLRAAIQNAWTQLQQPIQISEEYDTWIQINPQAVAMSPIQSDETSVNLKVAVTSLPAVSVGTQPSVGTASQLPPFAFDEVSDSDFKIILPAAISYQQAETLALQNIKGETFSSGKYKVTIEDLELYGQGDRLVIDTQLSGSYQGSIYLVGEPYYNKLRNRVDIKNLDYTLNTKNFLLRTAGWLIKSNMKKKITENINLFIDYNIEEVKKQAKEQFERYEMAPGIILNSQLNDLNITDVYLNPEGIQVQLGIKGTVNVGMEAIQMTEHTKW